MDPVTKELKEISKYIPKEDVKELEHIDLSDNEIITYDDLYELYMSEYDGTYNLILDLKRHDPIVFTDLSLIDKYSGDDEDLVYAASCSSNPDVLRRILYYIDYHPSEVYEETTLYRLNTEYPESSACLVLYTHNEYIEMIETKRANEVYLNYCMIRGDYSYSIETCKFLIKHLEDRLPNNDDLQVIKETIKRNDFFDEDLEFLISCIAVDNEKGTIIETVGARRNRIIMNLSNIACIEKFVEIMAFSLTMNKETKNIDKKVAKKKEEKKKKKDELEIILETKKTTLESIIKSIKDCPLYLKYLPYNISFSYIEVGDELSKESKDSNLHAQSVFSEELLDVSIKKALLHGDISEAVEIIGKESDIRYPKALSFAIKHDLYIPYYRVTVQDVCNYPNLSVVLHINQETLSYEYISTKPEFLEYKYIDLIANACAEELEGFVELLFTVSDSSELHYAWLAKLAEKNNQYDLSQWLLKFKNKDVIFELFKKIADEDVPSADADIDEESEESEEEESEDEIIFVEDKVEDGKEAEKEEEPNLE